jgi:hypothetical protein
MSYSKSNRLRRIRWVALAVVAGVASLASCDDSNPVDPGPTPAPAPVASVAVQPATLTLVVGDTITLRATARSAAGVVLERTVTWTSGQPERATVTEVGFVTALESGPVRITATSENRSGFADVTVAVVPGPPPEPPVITALEPAEIHAGGPAHTVRILGTNFRPDARVQFKGATRSSERVSETELRVALPPEDIAAVGEAELTVINPTEGQASTPAVLRIVAQPNPVTALAVHPSLAYTTVGAAVPLNVTALGADGAPAPDRWVTYSSGNPLVATVDGEGVVHPVGIGEVVITVRSEGVETTAVIEVRDGHHHHIMAGDGVGLVSLDMRLGTPPLRFWENWPGSWSESPSASPDGRFVAYVVAGSLVSNWAIVDLLNRTYIFMPAPGPVREVAWSPAGDRIAFTSLVEGRWHVLTIRPDGTGLDDLTDDLSEGQSAIDPAWSPDGSRIVYAVDGDAASQGLMIMNSDGSGKRYLTVGSQDLDPAWLGDIVAFMRRDETSGATDLWRVSVSGFGPLMRLTHTGRAHSPAFAPDHLWIVYVEGAGQGPGALMAIRPFGEEVRPIFIPAAGEVGMLDPVWVVRP